MFNHPGAVATLLCVSLCMLTARGDEPEGKPEPEARPSGAPVDPLKRYPDNGCVACHASLPGKLSQSVADWSESIHFQKEVTCESCHGGDPDIKGLPGDRRATEAAHHSTRGFIERPTPARRVSYFCGQCHVAIMEKHLGSPHGENGHPTCLYCHGNHAIHASSTKIIDVERCTVCHDFGTAEKIREMLQDTEEKIEGIGEQLAWLEENGYKNLALEEMHEHSFATVTQLRIAFHSFNLRDISNFASQIRTVAEQTGRTVDFIQNKNAAVKFQTWIGLIICGYLFLFSCLLMWYKSAYLDPREDGSES